MYDFCTGGHTFDLCTVTWIERKMPRKISLCTFHQLICSFVLFCIWLWRRVCKIPFAISYGVQTTRYIRLLGLIMDQYGKHRNRNRDWGVCLIYYTHTLISVRFKLVIQCQINVILILSCGVFCVRCVYTNGYNGFTVFE